MEIGEKVRAERLARQWSQGALATYSGLKGAHVSLLEAGKRSPKLPTLLKLAAAFRMPLADLIAGTALELELSGVASKDGQAPMIGVSDEVVHGILSSLDHIGLYVKDVPGLLDSWAHLPPPMIEMVADMLHAAVYSASHQRKGEPVTRQARAAREKSPEVRPVPLVNIPTFASGMPSVAFDKPSDD